MYLNIKSQIIEINFCMTSSYFLILFFFSSSFCVFLFKKLLKLTADRDSYLINITSEHCLNYNERML